jgi:hypothetical protein
MFVPAPTGGFFNRVALQYYMTYALAGSSVSYHGSHTGGEIFLEIYHWIFLRAHDNCCSSLGNQKVSYM